MLRDAAYYVSLAPAAVVMAVAAASATAVELMVVVPVIVILPLSRLIIIAAVTGAVFAHSSSRKGSEMRSVSVRIVCRPYM